VPVRTIIKGDQISLSIAAASIIAKVARDQMMTELHTQYPPYAWADNAGYGTPAHLAALAQFGPTPHHRRSFAPVRNLVALAN
jgi:ribonuclease HII